MTPDFCLTLKATSVEAGPEFTEKSDDVLCGAAAFDSGATEYTADKETGDVTVAVAGDTITTTACFAGPEMPNGDLISSVIKCVAVDGEIKIKSAVSTITGAGCATAGKSIHASAGLSHQLAVPVGAVAALGVALLVASQRKSFA